MPRRSGDFENNDDIYKEIENHDKGLNLTLKEPIINITSHIYNQYEL